jgi:hypothetical protein
MNVRLADGEIAVVRIELGVLSHVAAAINVHLANRSYRAGGETILAQTTDLLSCQPFSMEDGRVGLVLELDQLKLPVVIPLQGIPELVHSLERAMDLASARIKPSAN